MMFLIWVRIWVYSWAANGAVFLWYLITSLLAASYYTRRARELSKSLSLSLSIFTNNTDKTFNPVETSRRSPELCIHSWSLFVALLVTYHEYQIAYACKFLVREVAPETLRLIKKSRSRATLFPRPRGGTPAISLFSLLTIDLSTFCWGSWSKQISLT